MRPIDSRIRILTQTSIAFKKSFFVEYETIMALKMYI